MYPGFFSDFVAFSRCIRCYTFKILSDRKGTLLQVSPITAGSFVVEEVIVHNTGIILLLSTSVWIL